MSETEKCINMSSTPAICSTIYSLDSAKSSRLVSDALGKFFPLTEYWNLYRTDIYRIHRVPANQTVPVRDVIPSRFTVPFTPVNQIFRFGLAGQNVYAKTSLL